MFATSSQDKHGSVEQLVSTASSIDERVFGAVDQKSGQE
jgi:hypothetical protein